MTKKDMFKKPNSSEDETMNAQRITFWKDGKGWVEKPSLEKKLQDVSESYVAGDSNSHYYVVVGKWMPTVYSVYLNTDGTVQAADEPSLPVGYVKHLTKVENPLQKQREGA
jgi:hypothetical protein